MKNLIEEATKVSKEWLSNFKTFLIGFMALAFVACTVAGSAVVGTLVMLFGVAVVFAKLTWVLFVVLAVLAGIGLLLGVIVI